MNVSSLTAAQLVQSYLVVTGDNLNADVCKSLGLPYGKHYLHDLRKRLLSLELSGSVHSGNHFTNGQIGSHYTSASALKTIIDGQPSEVFSTNDLRDCIKVSNSVMSKALKRLEIDGIIERISSSRPYKYRRISAHCSDFTQVFMEVHGLIAPTSSISIRGLPLYANRALCGMPLEGVDLSGILSKIVSRHEGQLFPSPPPSALEPCILAVLNASGDVRAAGQELKKAQKEALVIQKFLDRLPKGATGKCSLTEYYLPSEWLTLLDSQDGIEIFIESATQAIGGELHPKEAFEIAGKAVKKTLMSLRSEGDPVDFGSTNSILDKLGSNDRDYITSILYDSVKYFAMREGLPVSKSNLKEMYRRIAWEIARSRIEVSSGQSE